MTTRVQFDVTKEGLELLETTMDLGNIGTKKECINKALSFFFWALNEKKLGRSICSVDETNNKYKEILL